MPWPRAALLSLLLLLGPGVAAQALRFFSTEYPPYAGAGLPGGGAIVELTRALLRPHGAQVQVDLLPWARLPQELASGRYDGVLLLWPRDVELHGLQATAPIFISRLGLYVRREQLRAQGPPLAELRRHRVGVVHEYAYPEAILNAGLRLDAGVSDEANLRKLAAGRYDYALVEKAVGEHLLHSGRPGLSPRELAWQEPALVDLPLLIGVLPGRPGSATLLHWIEQGLQQQRRSGALARLAQRHRIDLAPEQAEPR